MLNLFFLYFVYFLKIVVQTIEQPNNLFHLIRTDETLCLRKKYFLL
ncbi:hypothetical protein SCHRY_v1c07180 [Spiroplasma chrysopicola DF-1]|uniref:Uncharacterized protein n=1 Tax=Spiroplasma chrysopicola DF-1 TaxID=1276227 RepID=R4UBL3_9MOLU|nr:hypothetical protein SCHRY_v1c07180 [Spiroplasma chrysopicola DF-1]